VRLRFGDFVLDADARQLFRGAEEIHLQPKAFELLHLLVVSRPKALSKLAIRAHVWPETVVGEASLTVAVAELRAALGDDAKEPLLVRTVYGFGYAFAGEVVEDEPPEIESRRARSVAGASVGRLPRVLWEKRVIPLLEGENVLGRDDGVTVRIDAPGISRRHACIRIAGVESTIEDLGSKNGTFLEMGQPLRGPAPLHDGATFWLGRLALVFRNEPESGSTLTEHHG
jgi:DNA-binding winged helix-turn-helix (wHTH) protein